MGLFNKKTQVPEIPKSTSTPTTQAHLPIPTQPYPTSQAQTPETPHTATVPAIPKQTTEPSTPISIPEPTPSISQEEMPTITKELKYKQELGSAIQEQPFFVRIDKFSETKENFEKINEKIQEMERILQSLEATQSQEEKEIEEWKKDVIEMKSYLTQIDKEIFSKI